MYFQTMQGVVGDMWMRRGMCDGKGRRGMCDVSCRRLIQGTTYSYSIISLLELYNTHSNSTMLRYNSKHPHLQQKSILHQKTIIAEISRVMMNVSEHWWMIRIVVEFLWISVNLGEWWWIRMNDGDWFRLSSYCLILFHFPVALRL